MKQWYWQLKPVLPRKYKYGDGWTPISIGNLYILTLPSWPHLGYEGVYSTRSVMWGYIP